MKFFPRKKINLTIATGIDECGGVATVLSTLNDGFFQSWDMRLIKSHTETKSPLSFLKLLIYISALLKMLCYLVIFDVGIIHIHMSSRTSYLRKSYLVDIAKIFSKKVVLHLHGGEFQVFYHKESNSKKKKRIRSTFKKCDAVIVLSSQWHSWVKDELSVDPNKLHIVYNAAESLDLDSNAKEVGLVLFLGRLGKHKGLHDLIESFYQVAQENSNAHLAIGGDGDPTVFQKRVKELGIDSRVSFLGWVGGESKLNWLSKADVYCLPSYNEGFPMGVIEAMSAGIPVVSTKVGGVPDAIEHNIDGYLIDPGDIQNLTASLLNLIRDRDINSRFAVVSKEKFENNFSKAAVFPVLDKIYRDLLSD